MPKRKKGKNKSEEDKKKETNTLAVGKYTTCIYCFAWKTKNSEGYRNKGKGTLAISYPEWK